ncbi:MAG: CCA tRNA nucleotidyltransferase [Phycisphaerae bacterium]
MANTPVTKRQCALEITHRLQSHGFQAFWAGGCVRDQLLGIEPKDYDIATSAKPDEIRKLFPHSQLVGAAFGVIIVRRHHYATEVATFRTDGLYRDGRRPESVEFATARADAQRRDFTINGMFFDPIREELIDYVEGRADITARMIRAIGDPEHRFAEDHLRMMRAIRFASRFHFDIEPHTLSAIRRLHDKIKLISRERIGLELRGLISTPDPLRGVTLLADAELLGDIWPEKLPGEDIGGILRNGWMGKLPSAARFEVYLAALAHDLSSGDGPGAAFWPRLQNQFMLSNDEVSTASWISDRIHELINWRKLTRSRMKRIMADRRLAGLKELYFSLCDDAVLREYLAELEREGVSPEPLISGEDLIAMGASPGPDFKRWLNQLYDLQLENAFADKAGALAAARRFVSEAEKPR